MGKSFWIVLSVAVVVLLGVFFFFNDNDTAPTTNNENPHEITDEDHTKGPADAAVTLVEYGDFQCPACAAAYPMVNALAEDYPEDLRIVYRHFPLTQIHPQAYDAARASEAAARQGMFWELHDVLFERQEEWSGNPNARSLFEGYAEEIGLDLDRYNSDFNDASPHVDRGVTIGQQLNVTGTPTFFLNGEQIDNPRTYEEFTQIIEEAIAARQE